MTSPSPTKAQAELLIWMIKTERRIKAAARKHGHYWRNNWRGGDLINYYAEKAEARRAEWDKARSGDTPAPRDHGYMGAGGYASHGWRRAGGTALKNLERAGFVDWIGVSIGVPLYMLNTAGRDAAKRWPILQGQRRGESLPFTVCEPHGKQHHFVQWEGRTVSVLMTNRAIRQYPVLDEPTTRD